MVAADLDADTKAKVLRQVEFYFSDSNLPGDRFMLKAIEESPDRLIRLALICSFSRMRNHLGLKEHGPEDIAAEITEAVADVLRQSTSLRLSDDGSKVGRVTELKSTDEVQGEVNARSIAASPLPWNVTLDEVEAYFKEHAQVNSVRLPRLPGGKVFCGCATVELASEEEFKRVLELKLMFNGAELDLEPKKAFDERQVLDEQNWQANKQKKWNESMDKAGEEEEEDEDGYPKGLVVSFNLKKVCNAEEEKAGEKAGNEGATEKTVEAPEEESKVEKGIDPATQVAREDIKETLDKFGKINFVDFSRGDVHGYVRFDQEEAAQRARANAVLASEGGLLVKQHVLTLDPVEGEAEKEYWKKLRKGQGMKRDNKGHTDWGRGRGGRSGRGRSGRGRGRWGDRNEERPSNGAGKGKHTRFDDDTSNEATKAARTE